MRAASMVRVRREETHRPEAMWEEAEVLLIELTRYVQQKLTTYLLVSLAVLEQRIVVQDGRERILRVATK